QLKLHEVAITPTCMKYQNHVVSAIAPKIYEVPYIGQEAYKIQLEQEKQRLQEYEKDITEYSQKINMLKDVMGCLNVEHEQAIKYNITTYSEYRFTKNTLDKAVSDEERLKKNTTFIEKQIQLENIENEMKVLSDEIRSNDKEIGSCERTIQIAKESIQSYQSKIDALEQELRLAEQMIQDDINTVARDFEQLLKQKDMHKLKEDYEKVRVGNRTKRDYAISDLVSKMNEYKSAHDFGAEASMQGYSSFLAEYDKLKNSEILKYQEQVVKAKKIAEEEFREQFLSKLQENIKKAHGEMKLLNKALENITFGSEKYKFEFSPSKKYSMYYDMIMDDFNLMEGNSIFSGIFNETHREVIEELFEKLTAEGENSTKVLEEFTDYRSYMDYDIKIDHGDGSFSYYSKVCEEKSGGETQTPFYVTVAASFLQLYSNSIGGESIGLILFDEAFNNMDDERISGVLEFFQQLKLQIIVAAPPDKIQYITPSIQNTLLVLKDNETSYVERYSYEGV
ncbi:MAG: SbcC/MukB-like Walker B domain-containing protein, partial [Clostridiales bacterium]|nr:SbcC/MukB-like Walker B domain-containing protein [Clostridiales bacterium]